MADTILSVKESREPQFFPEGTEGPWAKDFKALQHEVAVDKHDIANCARGLLKLQEELRQMQERAAKSESLELQQLREELNELRDKVKGWSQMQEGVEREEARFEKVTKQPPILAIDAEHGNVRLKKDEVLLAFAEGASTIVDLDHMEFAASMSPRSKENSRATADVGRQQESKELEEEGGASTVPSDWPRSPIMQYQWNQSLWDVSIFIGTERMSIPSSLIASACLVCYMVLCGVIVTECERAMSRSSLERFNTDTRREFQNWRTTVAHDVKLRNTVTGESLASGVCNQRMYVPYSSLQLEAVQLLSDYLDTRSVFGLTVRSGALMCMLVLCIWVLTLLKELEISLDFLAAFLSRPFSSRTTFEPDMLDPSAAQFVSVSRCRFLIVIILFAARFLVLILVGMYGSVLLIQETSLTEMLLNAVGMQFILDLDELIFSALLPKRSRSTLARIRPMRYQWLGHRKWFASLLLVTSLIVIMKITLLDPFVVGLQDNYDALCGAFDGSSLDFVISVDSIGIPWAAKTQSVHSMPETYAQHAVSDVIKFGFPRTEEPLQPSERANRGLFMQIGSAFELEKFMGTHTEFQSPQRWNIINPQEIDVAIGWNEALVLGGANFGDEPGTVYNKYLQYLLGVSGDVNCTDVPLHLCYEKGFVMKKLSKGFVLRKLCPSWCGCDSPTAGTVSSALSSDAKLGLQGCSAWVTRTRSFFEVLGELPCADTSMNDVFLLWLQGIGDARNASGGSLADQVLASFQSGGCDAVAKADLDSGTRLCVESSLPAICPVSCGCDRTVDWSSAQTWILDYCPHSCGTQQHICFTIAVNHEGDTGHYGPFEGFQCIFPFEYEGKTYNNCTADDWTGPWCAVTLKDGQMYHWGDCPLSC